ncbi:Calcium-activated potassium channel slo-1 [Hondaea fermentalgiana]|uniref:Calcium-activated potassium channel slo-1 n=1 Tax=Hondaea fermentalgiana TaxID=2315210 RepID=A0A2R5GJ81_9STRA|nr:Calcium-activated potassium channel slo-1 [Hondaea fermentalgiana]|eukprot:GBG28713.1 Calcium-activated potassium channel slo-1 [Hondaea fermentalgiana]
MMRAAHEKSAFNVLGQITAGKKRSMAPKVRHRASSYAISEDLADNANEVFERHRERKNPKKDESAKNATFKVGKISGIDAESDADTKQNEDLRKRIRVYLATTILGYLLDLFNGIFSVLSVCLVVATTYYSESDIGLYLDLGICCFFLADYLLRLFIADSRAEQIFSWQALLDAVTILPTFAELWSNFRTISSTDTAPWIYVVLSITLVYLRIFRLLRLRRLLLYLNKEQKKEIGLVILQGVTGLLFVAAVLFVVENTFRLPLREDTLSYHEIMYFLVVTFSTVGYGDISMVTVPGKMLVTGIICLTLLYIPRWTNIILKNIGNTSIYRRAQYVASPHVNHVIVTGFLDSVSMRDFLKELFHPDHGNPTLHVVFLIQGSPSEEVLRVLEASNFRARTTYLDGSPLSTRDLARACVTSASACFILANKFTHTPHNDDAVAILKALSLKRFVMHHHRSDILVCMQFIRPESKALFNISRASIPCHLVDQVISIEQVKMDILAKSCLCPGFVTMLNNLVGSMESDQDGPSTSDDLDQLQIPATRHDNKGPSNMSKRKIFPSFRSLRSEHALSQGRPLGEPAWMADYKRGAGYEIYRVNLGNAFNGVPFAEAAEILHRRLGIVFFAIDIQAPYSQRYRVVLNPGRFRIPDVEMYRVHAYVIAEDERRAPLNISQRTTHPAMSILVRELSAARKLQDLVSSTQKHSEDALQEESLSSDEQSSTTTKQQGGLWAAMRNDLTGDANASQSLQEAEDFDKYTMAQNAVSLEDATVEISLARELPSVREHVVVVGSMDHIVCFVKTLRLKYLREMIPIILLAEEPPSETAWSRLSSFPLLFFVRGTPLDGDDLCRAGITYAKTVIIATKGIQSSKAGTSGKIFDAQTAVDANAILVRKTILQMNPCVDIIVEVVNSDNLHLLGNDDDLPERMGVAAHQPGVILSEMHARSGSSRRNLDGESFDSAEPIADLVDAFHALKGEHAISQLRQEERQYTLLASGQIFPTAMLDVVICQSFYNPHLISVLQLLISSNHGTHQQELTDELASVLGPFHDSNLYQVPIPKEYVGETYGDLFLHFTRQQGILPLGLLRAMYPSKNRRQQASRTSYSRYVSMNPAQAQELYEDDQVFILSPHAPEGAFADRSVQAENILNELARKRRKDK